MNRILIGLLWVCVVLSAQAKGDSTYVETFPDKINLRIYAKSGMGGFSLIDRNIDKKVSYMPNSSMRLGMGVNYRWFGLALALKTPSNDVNEKGNSSGLDLQGNIYKRKFIMDVSYRRIDGFYINNPREVFGQWESKAFPQREDVSIRSLGFAAYYVSNWRKFSYRSTFIFNEKQMKSSGSLLMGIYANRFRVDATRALVPDEVQSDFHQDLYMQSAKAGSIGIAIGYVYNLVLWKSWFLNLSAVPGVGFSNFVGKNENDEEIDFEDALSGKLDLRFALGRNGINYFWGISGAFNNLGYSNQGDLNFNFNYGNFRLTFGYRFHCKNKTINRIIKK